MVGILAAIGAIGTVAGAINSVVGVAKTAMGFFGGRRGGGGGGGILKYKYNILKNLDKNMIKSASLFTFNCKNIS